MTTIEQGAAHCASTVTDHEGILVEQVVERVMFLGTARAQQERSV